MRVTLRGPSRVIQLGTAFPAGTELTVVQSRCALESAGGHSRQSFAFRIPVHRRRRTRRLTIRLFEPRPAGTARGRRHGRAGARGHIAHAAGEAASVELRHSAPWYQAGAVVTMDSKAPAQFFSTPSAIA